MELFNLHSKLQKSNKEARDRHLELKPFFDQLHAALEIHQNMTKALALFMIGSLVLQITLLALFVLR